MTKKLNDVIKCITEQKIQKNVDICCVDIKFEMNDWLYWCECEVMYKWALHFIQRLRRKEVLVKKEFHFNTHDGNFNSLFKKQFDFQDFPWKYW